ncbi:hypothetical protein BN1058_01291 [Paraliobacillus sp. PM-2]|uniref:DUF3813 domain-containing protein n=1 Tax=Paraliobacillus sp. PM-2 TaxID=1462524 RepID=UPI00061C41F7|nr:DUF3813 domain-containing protein [Paraliobacillus sp. PM-2]CQR47002.1 hypothetical protein BN1058_01291 [Paraliobacillus sp. PM-2]
MENRLIQQAKQAIQRITNGNTLSNEDKQAATNAIQSAYTKATPEEQKELQKLEQQLRDHQELR